jgi:hypothetical protein
MTNSTFVIQLPEALSNEEIEGYGWRLWCIQNRKNIKFIYNDEFNQYFYEKSITDPIYIRELHGIQVMKQTDFNFYSDDLIGQVFKRNIKIN